MKITCSSNHWSWTLEETWWLLNFNKLQWLLSGLLAPWQSWHLFFLLWPWQLNLLLEITKDGPLISTMKPGLRRIFHVGDKLGNVGQALSYDFMFLLSLPFIPAAKSIMANSHTCSLQIHGGMAQCLQSEWYGLHELHYTTSKWSYYHWKWCNYTGRSWKEVVHMWCTRQLRKLWTEACHHCIGRVGISCTGPLQPHTPAPNSAHGISGSSYQLLMAAMVALAFLAVWWFVFIPGVPLII